MTLLGPGAGPGAVRRAGRGARPGLRGGHGRPRTWRSTPSADALTAVSPVAGTVVKLHPHAFVVVADDGRGVLVHLGIDTVQLKGDGFELLIAEGDRVAAGDARREVGSRRAVEAGRTVAGGAGSSRWAMPRPAAPGPATREGRLARRRRAVPRGTGERPAVFDLDGTLVLTEERNRVVWKRFFDGYGIEVDDALTARA